MCLEGWGWEKKGDTWLVGAELVFLCSGNEGSLPLLSPEPLLTHFFFLSWVFFPLPLFLPAWHSWGRGWGRGEEAVGNLPGQLGGI